MEWFFPKFVTFFILYFLAFSLFAFFFWYIQTHVFPKDKVARILFVLFFYIWIGIIFCLWVSILVYTHVK
jgi:hypothetical protein